MIGVNSNTVLFVPCATFVRIGFWSSAEEEVSPWSAMPLKGPSSSPRLESSFVWPEARVTVETNSLRSSRGSDDTGSLPFERANWPSFRNRRNRRSHSRSTSTPPPTALTDSHCCARWCSPYRWVVDLDRWWRRTRRPSQHINPLPLLRSHGRSSDSESGFRKCAHPLSVEHSVTKIGQQLLTSQLCRTAGTTAHGTIDFTSHSLTLNVISRTCSGSSTTKWAMEQREVKGTLFATLPRVSGGFRLPFPPTPPSRPWLAGASARLATGSMSGVGGVSSSLTTGFLPTVLHAIHGRVTKVGTRVIEGTIATGYRTTISLADLQQSSRKESRLSGASFENISSPRGSLPAATTIPIQLAIWVDAPWAESVSFWLTQPFYFLRYADGSGPGGPQIYPSEYLGRQGSTGPYKTHDVVVSVSLSDFGTPSPLSAPPPSQIDSSYSPNV